MTTGLIIAARYDSSRLPGKMLLPIGPRPLLGCVVDRVRRVSGGHPIVIATSARETDNPIAEFARSEGLDVYRGAHDDVAGRMLACAQERGFAQFARICGDRPFLDPGLIETLLERLIVDGLDLATNNAKKTFPTGMTTEVISTDALRRALSRTVEPQDREHVTGYFYSHPENFRIFNLEAPDDTWTDVNLALDTADDLARARWMANRLEKPAFTRLEDVIALARAWTAEAGANDIAGASGT